MMNKSIKKREKERIQYNNNMVFFLPFFGHRRRDDNKVMSPCQQDHECFLFPGKTWILDTIITLGLPSMTNLLFGLGTYCCRCHRLS